MRRYDSTARLLFAPKNTVRDLPPLPLCTATAPEVVSRSITSNATNSDALHPVSSSASKTALSRRFGRVLPVHVASIAPRSGSATGGRGFSLGAGSFTLLIGLRQLFYAESPAHEHPTGFKVWQPDNKKACQVVCHLTGFVLFLPCHDGAIIVARVGLRVGPVLVSIVPQHVKQGSSHNSAIDNCIQTVCINPIIHTVCIQLSAIYA